MQRGRRCALLAEKMSTLWDRILLASSKGEGADLPRNVAVLGDAGCGKHALVAALTGASAAPSAASGKAVGLDFRYTSVRDASGDAVGCVGYWRLQGDALAHAGLLQVAQASLALLVVDVARPLDALVASLDRWRAAVNPPVPVVVVATKTDALREEDDCAPLHAALRRWCVAHDGAALVFCSPTTGTNVALLREYVEHLLYPQQRALTAAPELVLFNALFVPARTDKAEAIEGPELAAVADGGAAALPSKTPRVKGDEPVEAESEQAFLLRHMKILEAAAAEEAAAAPSTPVALSSGLAATPSAGDAATTTTTTTPLKTPAKTPSKPAFQTPTTPAVEDHAELANFFNSLISKEKSPYKGPAKK